MTPVSAVNSRHTTDRRRRAVGEVKIPDTVRFELKVSQSAWTGFDRLKSELHEVSMRLNKVNCTNVTNDFFTNDLPRVGAKTALRLCKVIYILSF